MKRIIVIILSLLIANPVYAKLARFEDAKFKNDLLNMQIDVSKAGGITSLTESRYEILREDGRSLATNYTLYYNKDNEKITILDAKTIYKGKEFKVDLKYIEDKPLASAQRGFDQTHQILIAFPKAEIGAKIYIKYKHEIFKPVIDNFYSELFEIGSAQWDTHANIKINSQIPLNIKVNDPSKSLKIIKDNPAKVTKLEISLKKDIYNEIDANEPRNSFLNYKYKTWIAVSSYDNWQKMAADLAKQNFAHIYSQQLPDDFAQIVNAANLEKNDVDKINKVTSMLNDKIHYMGDWRTINGRYTPRDLAKISETQIGDCKDFSASTVAILTKLGFKAQFSLVRRGVGDYYPDSLPTISAFNHVFVKVTANSGKIYFVDPTNFQSMADGIFPDIAGKMSLVLDTNNPSYEKIPDIDPMHAQSLLIREINILDDYKVFEKGTLTMKNEEAMYMTGAALNSSEDSIKEILFKTFSGTNIDDSKKNMKLPKLDSRIVKDIVIDYSYEQKNRTFKTNLGQGFGLNYSFIKNLIDNTPENVADIIVDAPHSVLRKTYINNINVLDFKNLNKKVITPWLDITRTLTLQGKNLLIIEEIMFKKSIIAREEFKNPEFIKLKDILEKDFDDVAIIFTKLN
jgi:hypothetical protein